MPNKLALIYPSRQNERYSLEGSYGPLALAYAAAYTPEDWSISLHDEIIGDFADPGEIDADLVAISALTPNILRAYYLADKLRARGRIVVGGGAHVSSLPKEALEHFDAIVVGEAEPVWGELLADFGRGDLQQVYEGGFTWDLADIRLPRRDMIHPDYQFPSVMTSKGCPYACDYCYLSAFSEKEYRVLPADTILEDLERVKRARPTIFVFVDENIAGYSSSDIENRMALFEGMISRRIGLTWGAQASIDIARQPELLRVMRRAGCRALFLGIESVDGRLGEQVNKGFVDGCDHKTAIATIHKHGIGVIGSFILGLDSHTPAYARQLPEAMRSMGVDYPRVFFLTAWPGTPMHDRMERDGRTIPGWAHVRKDIPSLRYLNFSEKEIREAMHNIYSSMFTPGHIATLLRRWVFRAPLTLLKLLRLVLGNMSRRKHAQAELMRERSRRIEAAVADHFRENPLATEESLSRHRGGTYHRA